MTTKKSADEIMQEALAAFGAGEVDLKQMLGPQPRDNNPSEVYGLMDASGSMGGYEDVTKAAMCEFVLNITKQTFNCNLTLETFDHLRIEKLLLGVPIQSFRPQALDRYVIRGGTALYDVVIEVCYQLLELPTRTRNVLVVQTDGEDYDSAGSPAEAYHAIGKLRRHGWEVVFTGANSTETGQLRLANTAKKLGILPTNTLCYDHSNTAALAELGKNIGGYISGQRDTTGFTAAQRKLAGDLRKHTQSLARSDTTAGIKGRDDRHRRLLSKD